MKLLVITLLLSVLHCGCSSPAVEYRSAVLAIRSMAFTKSFLEKFGDDCLVTATYYDGQHADPGAVINVVYDRRYQISAHCDVLYSAGYQSIISNSSWTVSVSEITSAEINSHGTATTYYGRTWRYNEAEWTKAMQSGDGLSALHLPVIPEARGNGIALEEQQYGRSGTVAKPEGSAEGPDVAVEDSGEEKK